MAQNSSIEWTEATWNPVTGCTKVSPGCKFCYAERMAKRLKAMGQVRYADGFRLTLQPDVVEAPLRWRSPRTIFVNSMSDLFHKDVPLDYIQQVFATMEQAHWHTFQVLTKRADRLEELACDLPWPRNVWMGVSVENADSTWRIEHLQRVPAQVRFLSVEPLLGPIPDLPLAGIHWVIVGGESGPGARPMDPAWVTDLRDQCVSAKVPFFFKQWGGVNKGKTGRVLEGRVWDGMPGRFRYRGVVLNLRRIQLRQTNSGSGNVRWPAETTPTNTSGSQSSMLSVRGGAHGLVEVMPSWSSGAASAEKVAR